MTTTIQEGVWGPTAIGVGLRWRRRKLLTMMTAVLAVVVAVFGAVTLTLFEVADDNVKRLPFAFAPPDEGRPLNVLVVGSDSREGLSDAEIAALHLGDFEGQRGDTMFILSVSRDQVASVVSFPRDLLVNDGGQARKLTETFAEGPEHVVDVVTANFGVPIHHYVEVSIPGFISVVDAIGGVRICLEDPLVDDKSGADFAAGCHEMTPEQALAFVRSRSTTRGDFDRIARQQVFMRALIDKVISTRMLVDVPRLFQVVERVSRHVTTDSGMGPSEMRSLARRARELAGGTVPMATVPAYAATIGEISYVIAYGPGARAMFAAVANGEPIAARGTADERAAVAVAVWTSDDRAAADVIQRTLFWSGFQAHLADRGPGVTGPATVVYSLAGQDAAAAWVAATLGVTATPLPAELTPPEGVQVVVVAGPDAQAEVGG